jgi:hypothetical protein
MALHASLSHSSAPKRAQLRTPTPAAPIGGGFCTAVSQAAPDLLVSYSQPVSVPELTTKRLSGWGTRRWVTGVWQVRARKQSLQVWMVKLARGAVFAHARLHVEGTFRLPRAHGVALHVPADAVFVGMVFEAARAEPAEAGLNEKCADVGARVLREGLDSVLLGARVTPSDLCSSRDSIGGC